MLMWDFIRKLFSYEKEFCSTYYYSFITFNPAKKINRDAFCICKRQMQAELFL